MITEAQIHKTHEEIDVILAERKKNWKHHIKKYKNGAYLEYD